MKISYTNLEKIIATCTSKEISLIIYLAQYQNAKGVVSGIDYKEAATETEMSVQSFYNALRGLEEKDIIQVNHHYSLHGLIQMTILNNVFETKLDFKKGYLNIHFDFLHSKRFHKSSRVTKVLILKIYKIQDFKKKQLVFTFHSISKWTGIRLCNVKRSLKELSEILEIEIKYHRVTINLLVPGTENVLSNILIRRNTAESDVLARHAFETEVVKRKFAHKKDRHSVETENFHEIAKLFRQYGHLIGRDMVMEKVMECLNTAGSLIPRYIHKILSKIYHGVCRKRAYA